jgi:hypothetical protein
MPRERTGSATRPVDSSFRDPAGFVYFRDGCLYRQVNRSHAAAFDDFVSCGLYGELATERLLVEHVDEPAELAFDQRAHRVLRPVPVPFVSYPYEWCFSQLRDAALLTLDVQRRALRHGFTLKDASAYNVQFFGSRPIMIDTLSFERWEEGRPWVAYRQFCEHFLAPLALMSYVDIRLGRLSDTFLDGVPLDLATRLLPHRTKWKVPLGIHLHAHARSQRRYAGARTAKLAGRSRFDQSAFRAWIDTLQAGVEDLRLRGVTTEWADYYEAGHNYSEEGLGAKERLVRDLLSLVRPATAWDLGANTGRFSRLCVEQGARTIAWDVDPLCVERNYRRAREDEDDRLLPLVLDLTNPSPAIGWEHRERMSFEERGPVNLVLALGLVHHLAISNNLPLRRVAALLARLCRWLIIELVPKEDSQVQRLLRTRQDIFPDYHEPGFREAFCEHFSIERIEEIPGTRRSLYLMLRKA